MPDKTPRKIWCEICGFDHVEGYRYGHKSTSPDKQQSADEEIAEILRNYTGELAKLSDLHCFYDEMMPATSAIRRLIARTAREARIAQMTNEAASYRAMYEQIGGLNATMPGDTSCQVNIRIKLEAAEFNLLQAITALEQEASNQ